MQTGMLVLTAGLVVLALLLLISDDYRRKHERLRMDRMRNDPLYAELYPLVRNARNNNVEEVRVERDRVLFVGVCPVGRMGEFVPEERGRRRLSPEATKALAQLLGDELPELQDETHYRFRRYRIIRPNGEKDWGYRYDIRRGYKAELMRRRERVQLY